MLIRPSHSAVLATCLRNLGWRPVAESAGQTDAPAGGEERPRIAVPALARQPGYRFSDPALWQWWELTQPAQWRNCGLPTEGLGTCLQRVFAVTLGDGFLARAILEQGPRVAPAAADRAGPRPETPGAAHLTPAALLTPFNG
jgi:hypothetical protein